MAQLPCATPSQTTPSVRNPDRDALWNSVAVSSVSYHRERALLADALVSAAGHGLSVDDLVAASGLDRMVVRRLLEETL